jgi:hypothetical protein
MYPQLDMTCKSPKELSILATRVVANGQTVLSYTLSTDIQLLTTSVHLRDVMLQMPIEDRQFGFQ